MKIIAIGDTHGRVKWKQIIEKNSDADRIVFIGDYFDTHDAGVSPNKQIVNFKEILAYKRENKDKVIMLIGNHDYHYMRGINETYSGYQAGYSFDIRDALDDALSDDSIQLCWIHDTYVFTHAGLTKTWCKTYLGNENPNLDVLQQSVNDLFKFKPKSFGFLMGDTWSQTGDDVTQGPLWVRPRSLMLNMLDGITCVVGHTQVRQLGLNKDFPRIILIDCLGFTDEYLVIEDGEPKIGN